MSALLLAISRSADDPKVTEDDIVEGCQMQMRGSLQMKAFLHRVVPKTGLDDLVLSSQMRKQVGISMCLQVSGSLLHKGLETLKSKR